MSDNHPWPNPYRKLPANPTTAAKFRYSRGFLPHIKYDGHLQMVTYRLADSLPAGVAQQLLDQARQLPRPRQDAEYRKKMEAWFDAGHGACWLKMPKVAAIVRDAWLFFDHQRYQLHAWVIMPNHVHLVVEEFPGHPLRKVVTSWKSYTAKAINLLLNRQGPVWQREHWDRYIRDQNHYAAAVAYLYENPVKAGLAKSVEAWPWSSWPREEQK